MALEEDLRQTVLAVPAVTAIVGSRVWWGILGGGWDVTSPTLPAIVLHLVDDIPQVSHSTRGATTSRARVQADCLAAQADGVDGLAVVRDLAAALIDGLLGREGTGFRVVDAIARDAHDPTAKRYRRMVDLDIWTR